MSERPFSQKAEDVKGRLKIRLVEVEVSEFLHLHGIFQALWDYNEKPDETTACAVTDAFYNAVCFYQITAQADRVAFTEKKDAYRRWAKEIKEAKAEAAKKARR